MKLNKISVRQVASLYTTDHLTTRQIGDKLDISHTSVRLLLKRAGVQAEQGEWVMFECTFCGQIKKRTRSIWRHSKKKFCTKKCFYASRYNPSYVRWRNGMRIARKIVAQYFELESGYVVHHIDGNERHNDLKNLAVFATHSDHLRYHHNPGSIAFLWSGQAIV